MRNLKAIAGTNAGVLRENKYPGRFFVIGLNEAGTHIVIVYSTMGRSEDSRNRILHLKESGEVATKAADPSKVKNRAQLPYLLYNATCTFENPDPCYVVSNGDQTDTVRSEMSSPGAATTLAHALRNRIHEEDSVLTSRITALISGIRAGKPIIEISVLRKCQWGDGCDRCHYRYENLPPAGIGLYMSTYECDGSPPPPRQGEPELMTIPGNTAAEIAAFTWDWLNPDNRVSLLTWRIPLDGSKAEEPLIINEYTEVT